VWEEDREEKVMLLGARSVRSMKEGLQIQTT
jgi:hypothetical protein